MLTAGIDLAAEPKNTALAKIEWSTDKARVLDLRVDVNDDAIVASATEADKSWPRRCAKAGSPCPTAASTT
jgi:hypothetical protein